MFRASLNIYHMYRAIALIFYYCRHYFFQWPMCCHILTSCFGGISQGFIGKCQSGSTKLLYGLIWIKKKKTKN